ncbi:MAG TPA: response regulator [Rubrobacteraceae bacterium]|nr:response regulator [Rubrobacteraceae bacterium]
MKRFLLLEASALFRESLALLLEWSAELEALQAGSVEEARRALGGSRNKIELAIVNVDSLNSNAIELIEELRGADPDVPVLALTADRSLEGRVRALRVGANDTFYLRAPVEELVDAVRRLGGAPQTTTADKIRSSLRNPA